ncbi:MAG: hypothetical protein ACE5DI_05920 [Candidatus Micrarchaeia archaeon]
MLEKIRFRDRVKKRLRGRLPFTAEKAKKKLEEWVEEGAFHEGAYEISKRVKDSKAIPTDEYNALSKIKSKELTSEQMGKIDAYKKIVKALEKGVLEKRIVQLVNAHKKGSEKASRKVNRLIDLRAKRFLKVKVATDARLKMLEMD